MTRDFIYGMLGGLAIGIAVGILFAPDRGRDTRRKISTAARPARERVGGFTASVGSRVRSGVETIRQAI